LKLDAHVHTVFSGKTNIWPVHRLLNESYSSPERVYQRAKSRGMDLVVVTDHDTIDGVLQIAHLDDVIVGCEVSGVFEDGVGVHLGVLDINEEQHREIQRLRKNLGELMPYLKQQGIFTTLNHVASRVAGHITASHIAQIIPWIDGIEILNGARLKSQNRTAAALADAYDKVGMAGSDSHTLNRIGQSYLVAEASDRAQFMDELRQGNVRVEGGHGSYFTLSTDIIRLSSSFYKDGLERCISDPLNWRQDLVAAAKLLCLPLVAVSLVGAIFYLILEGRFNDSLLVDLVATPASGAVEVV